MEIPPKDRPVNVECSIMRNGMASDTEVELVGLFENWQKLTYMRTALAEMVHSQPPTPVATYNTAEISIVNKTVKQERSRSIDKRFYWVRERIKQHRFHIFWE